MRVLQVLHDDERGGVQTLAALIASGLPSPRFAFETTYLYPRPALPVFTKLGCVFTMMRRIWRGDFDALVAYQSTASILVGVVGLLRGCRFRIVHQTCTPAETAAASAARTSSPARSASTALTLLIAPPPGRSLRLSGALSARDGPDRTRPRCAGADSGTAGGAAALRPAAIATADLECRPGHRAKKSGRAHSRLACVPQAHLALLAPARRTTVPRLAVTLGIETGCTCSAPCRPRTSPTSMPRPTCSCFRRSGKLSALPRRKPPWPECRLWSPTCGAARSVACRRLGARHFRRTAECRRLDRGDRQGVRRAAARRCHHRISRAPSRRKYSRQRMIESYVSLFEAYRRACIRRGVSALQPAAEIVMRASARALRSAGAGSLGRLGVLCRRAAERQPTPTFKRGATLVEFFEFPATTGDGAAKAYAVPAFPASAGRARSFRLRRIAPDRFRSHARAARCRPADAGRRTTAARDPRRSSSPSSPQINRHGLAVLVTLFPPSLQHELPETYLDGLDGPKFRAYSADGRARCLGARHRRMPVWSRSNR